MNKKLRHYLTEALVILAFIAIFGPMFFSRINKKNDVQPVEPPAFSYKEKNNAWRAPHPAYRDASSQNEPISIARPQAWIVELGSFTERSKAEALVTQLNAKNIRVFTDNVYSDNGSITRVYAGPVISRVTADALLKNIEHELHIKGTVIYFNPLEL